MSKASREDSDQTYYKTQESTIYHHDRDCQALKSAYSEIEEVTGPFAYNERECVHCSPRIEARGMALKDMNPDDWPP